EYFLLLQHLLYPCSWTAVHHHLAIMHPSPFLILFFSVMPCYTVAVCEFSVTRPFFCSISRARFRLLIAPLHEASCIITEIPKLGASLSRVLRCMIVSNTKSVKCVRTSSTT